MKKDFELVRIVEQPAWTLGNVLDVRSAGEFARGHLAPAVSLPLPEAVSPPLPGAARTPLAEAVLEQHLPSIFLPSRHESLLVVAATVAVAGAVCEYLRQRGRLDVQPCVVTPEQLAGLPRELVATGSNQRHLWRPPAFLAAHEDMLPPPEAGPVVDLGAGNGRAAVWLAGKGYRVTAVDRLPEALALGRRLAASQNVSCTFLQRDLRDPDQVPTGPWSLVLVFRYLERPLLQRMPSLLQSRGTVVVRTFRQVEGDEGPPSTRHRLADRELLRLLSATDFEVLEYDEDHSADGRPEAGIVARLWR